MQSFLRNISIATSVSKGLRSRILESLPKLSEILTIMRHYKKVSLMKQFLRKVLSFYFDYSQINSRFFFCLLEGLRNQLSIQYIFTKIRWIRNDGILRLGKNIAKNPEDSINIFKLRRKLTNWETMDCMLKCLHENDIVDMVSNEAVIVRS